MIPAELYGYVLLALLSVALGYFLRRSVAELKFQKKDRHRLEKSLSLNAQNINTLLRMLSDLHDYNISTTAIVNTTELYQTIVNNASRLLKTEMGSLMLLDRQTNELTIVAAKGLSDEVIKTTRMKIGEGVAGWVVANGELAFVEDVDRDIRFQRANNVKYTSKSFISVPLKVKERVIGVLNVNNKESKKSFDDTEKRLLTILADQAAITIENIELYRHMQKIYLGTIQTLARTIDAKSPYTKEHTERVTEYSVIIAERMSLPQELVKNIEYAAMMHDIGKIGVSEAILNKPGPLTVEERDAMNAHPLIGQRIIMPIEFLATIAPLIMYHHEHYDGRGYLEGLSGEEIPIGARVLSVADAYDAMTSDRSYKKAKSREDAVKELKRCSGSQFDPRIVEVFVRYLETELPSSAVAASKSPVS